jgi:hypothetical protein
MSPRLRAALATTAYALVHSVLASRECKDLAARLFGERFRNAFYRPFFLLQAVASFAALVIYLGRLPPMPLPCPGPLGLGHERVPVDGPCEGHWPLPIYPASAQPLPHPGPRLVAESSRLLTIRGQTNAGLGFRQSNRLSLPRSKHGFVPARIFPRNRCPSFSTLTSTGHFLREPPQLGQDPAADRQGDSSSGTRRIIVGCWKKGREPWRNTLGWTGWGRSRLTLSWMKSTSTAVGRIS